MTCISLRRINLSVWRAFQLIKCSMFSQSERLELNDSRKRVDMVVAMAQKLIDDYRTDDPSKLVADIQADQ
jgi:hypothetical protein